MNVSNLHIHDNEYSNVLLKNIYVINFNGIDAVVCQIDEYDASQLLY